MDATLPLVDRSISAHTLDSKLADLMERIDRLRLAQQPGRPKLKPPWWNDHLADPAWARQAGMFRSKHRSHRLQYLYWRVRVSVMDIRSDYPALFEGLDLTPSQRALVRDAQTAIETMCGILAPEQGRPRLRQLVIPEATQLELTLPEVYVPVVQSDHERWLQDEIDRACDRFLCGEIDYVVAQNLTRQLQRRCDMLAERRTRENRRRLRTKVTPERLAFAMEQVADWKKVVKRWGLAEAAVLRVLNLLRGDDQVGLECAYIDLPGELPDTSARGHDVKIPVHMLDIHTLGDGSGRAPGRSRSSGGEPGVFRIAKPGRAWQIVFAGTATVIKRGAGIPYILRLIQTPGIPVSWRNLAAESLPGDVPLDDGLNEASIDQEAIDEYRRVLLEIREDIHDAQRSGDEGALESALAKKEYYMQELKEAMHGGRPRVQSKGFRHTKKRIRTAVDRVIEELAENDQAAANHFRESIDLRDEPVYRPEACPSWEC